MHNVHYAAHGAAHGAAAANRRASLPPASAATDDSDSSEPSRTHALECKLGAAGLGLSEPHPRLRRFMIIRKPEDGSGARPGEETPGEESRMTYFWTWFNILTMGLVDGLLDNANDFDEDELKRVEADPAKNKATLEEAIANVGTVLEEAAAHGQALEAKKTSAAKDEAAEKEKEEDQEQDPKAKGTKSLKGKAGSPAAATGAGGKEVHVHLHVD